MASQKRSRTDGHLSKEQYNDGARSALSTQVSKSHEQLNIAIVNSFTVCECMRLIFVVHGLSHPYVVWKALLWDAAVLS